MENKQSGKLVTIVLAVLLVIALVFAFTSNAKHSKLSAELEQDKVEIKEELDKMIAEYDAKLSESTTLKAKLGAARHDIVVYRDSLTSQKKTSYSTLKRFKNRVWQLQKKNQALFQEVETLTVKNDSLNTEIAVANDTIAAQKELNTQLAITNTVLAKKVAIGAVLNVENLSAVAMKKQSSGALKNTTRYKKTNIIKTTFRIKKNELTEAGSKSAYFVIKDAEGNVVSEKGKINIGEEEFAYSDETVIDYNNEPTEVIVMTDVDSEKLTKGIYSIAVILDGTVVGNSTLELKDNFLGLF